jgi:hypothetical protein
MAKKVQVTLVDDIDGGNAAETIGFALDGSSYEIDLSKANAKKLRDSLSNYVAHARKAGRTRGAGRSGRAVTGTRSASVVACRPRSSTPTTRPRTERLAKYDGRQRGSVIADNRVPFRTARESWPGRPRGES